MNTALEMFTFAKENCFGHDTFLYHTALRDFEVVEGQLAPHEKVILSFMGEYKRRNGEALGHFAFALTDEKLIMGQKRISSEKSKQVYLKQFTDIRKKVYFMYGELIFDFQNDLFVVVMDPKDTTKTYNAITRLLGSREQKNDIDEIAQEILRFRKLAEEGYVTWSDFEEKKRKMLGI